MKNVLLVLFICAAISLSGCGLVDTADERHRRLTLGVGLQAREFVDDLDAVMMWDQACQLTEYHVESRY